MGEVAQRSAPPPPPLRACSDEPGKAVAMEGLQRLEGYVRKHVGKQVGGWAPSGCSVTTAVGWCAAGSLTTGRCCCTGWRPHLRHLCCTPALPAQIRLRLTPEIRFVRDDSIERSERIFKLLDQVGQDWW